MGGLAAQFAQGAVIDGRSVADSIQRVVTIGTPSDGVILLSFTSGDSTFFNVSLPNAGRRSPENLIAPFWDDLDFRVSGQAHTYYDGSAFIVSFENESSRVLTTQ